MERRIVSKMITVISENIGSYPKLNEWLVRSNATRYVKVMVYKLKQAKKL